jgi:hypothetical protein
MRWLVVALVTIVMLASVSSACTDQTDSDSAPYGCCEVGTTPPPQCTMKYGGAKRTPDDSCIEGYDGMLPDSNEPGWTQVTDENGCKRWTPPPNGRKVCCGCLNPPVIVDASTDAADGSDASDASASDSATDAATDATDASTD